MDDFKYIQEFSPDGFFGPNSPFGPGGFFGPNGPFGDNSPFGPGGPFTPGPGGPPGRPPQGPPDRRPDGPPGRRPDGPPSGPPPSFGPELSPYRVDKGSLRYCMYKYTRIRLENGRRFWFYPVYLSRNTVAGYRWVRRFNRWVYTGIDLDRISSFSC